jgi:hypothetical protein
LDFDGGATHETEASLGENAFPVLLEHGSRPIEAIRTQLLQMRDLSTQIVN